MLTDREYFNDLVVKLNECDTGSRVDITLPPPHTVQNLVHELDIRGLERGVHFFLYTLEFSDKREVTYNKVKPDLGGAIGYHPTLPEAKIQKEPLAVYDWFAETTKFEPTLLRYQIPSDIWEFPVRRRKGLGVRKAGVDWKAFDLLAAPKDPVVFIQPDTDIEMDGDTLHLFRLHAGRAAESWGEVLEWYKVSRQRRKKFPALNR